MGLTHLNDPVTLDDLVHSYLRYKNWMDYDTEHSAYCAKEIIVMQALFGTAYITAPPFLVTVSYEELLACMEKRQVTMGMFSDAVHTQTDRDTFDNLLEELTKSSFTSGVHYFTTLFEAVMQTAASARQNDEQERGNLLLDEEPLQDHFEEPNEATFEIIKNFIITEYPKTEFMSFSKERLHGLGLPRSAPADPF